MQICEVVRFNSVHIEGFPVTIMKGIIAPFVPIELLYTNLVPVTF